MVHIVLSWLMLLLFCCVAGRIVNRFSSDMTTVDETISQSISQLTNTLFSVFGALVGIAVATSGTFLIIMVRDDDMKSSSSLPLP